MREYDMNELVMREFSVNEFDMRKFNMSDLGMYEFRKNERNRTTFWEVKKWAPPKIVKRFMEEFYNGYKQLWLYAGYDAVRYPRGSGEGHCCT